MAWELTGNSGTNPTNNFLGTKDQQPLVIKTSGTERMRITLDGNIGIGTTDPGAYRLMVVGGDIRIAAKGKEGSLFGLDRLVGLNDLRFYVDDVGNTEKMHLDSNELRVEGNIRINDHDLWLRGATDKNHGIGWYGSGKIWAEVGSGELSYEIAPDGPVIFGYSGGVLATTKGTKQDALTWNSDGDVHVRGNVHVIGDVVVGGKGVLDELRVAQGATLIDPNGNLTTRARIGIGSLISPQAPLDIVSEELSGIRITNNAAKGNAWLIFHNSLKSSDDYGLRFSQDDKGVSFYPGGTIYADGNAYKPGGGSWGTYSDKFLKKNIQPLTGVLDKLLSLKGKTYEWKEPEKHGNLNGTQIGFIGQDVENVFPDWVTTSKDGYKMLTIRGFSAMTVEALRDLKNLCDALTKRINDLELNGT